MRRSVQTREEGKREEKSEGEEREERVNPAGKEKNQPPSPEDLCKYLSQSILLPYQCSLSLPLSLSLSLSLLGSFLVLRPFFALFFLQLPPSPLSCHRGEGECLLPLKLFPLRLPFIRNYSDPPVSETDKVTSDGAWMRIVSIISLSFTERRGVTILFEVFIPSLIKHNNFRHEKSLD